MLFEFGEVNELENYKNIIVMYYRETIWKSIFINAPLFLNIWRIIWRTK